MQVTNVYVIFEKGDFINPLPRAFVKMEKELEDLRRDIFRQSGLSEEETYDVFFQIYHSGTKNTPPSTTVGWG